MKLLIIVMALAMLVSCKDEPQEQSEVEGQLSARTSVNSTIGTILGFSADVVQSTKWTFGIDPEDTDEYKNLATVVEDLKAQLVESMEEGGEITEAELAALRAVKRIRSERCLIPLTNDEIVKLIVADPTPEEQQNAVNLLASCTPTAG